MIKRTYQIYRSKILWQWQLLGLLSLLFLCPQELCAQEAVKIGGTVTDVNGSPIELATVRIEGTAIGTVTNLKGRYSLKFTSRDSVTVVFSMLGYQTRKRLLLKPKGNLRLNMTLTVTDYELGEVSVSGQRRQTGTVQQLDMAGHSLAPDPSGGNIEALLATQAGVSNNNELSSQYNVRGGSFDENMVYVNGMEIYRPLLIRSGQQEGLSFVNPDMVENIAFSTGGFEARYGDKMSSVLDITYKRPQRLEGSASVSLLGASGYMGIAGRKFTWTHGLRYKTNRYLLGRLDTKGEYDPRFLDYQTYFSYRPNPKLEIGFIGNIAENRYQFRPEDRYTSFGTLNDIRQFKVYFEGQEKDLFRTFFGAGYATWHPHPHSSLSLRASAFRTQERETYDITGQYWLSSLDNESSTDQAETAGIGTYMEHARNYLTADVQSYSLEGRHRLNRHELQWGAELKHERIKDKMREWELRDSAGYSIPAGPDGPVLSYTLSSANRTDSHRYSFFVQDTYKHNTSIGLLTLTAGVRGSYWDWNREFILSPRLSVGLIPAFNDRLTFRAAWGIYYQAPFYKEFRCTSEQDGISTVTLNSDIRSQRSMHYVIGGDYHFRVLNRPFRFSAEVYYKDLDNLIPYNIDNVRIDYYGRNLAKGYATGLDMKLFGEFVPGTDSWISFSLMKTEEKILQPDNTTEGQTKATYGTWLPRPTDQRYRLSLYFTDYFPGSRKWKLSLTGTLADGLPFGPPHQGREKAVFRTPPYRRVDIGMSRCLLDEADTSARRRFVRSIWLSLNVFNLLDIHNVNSYYWITDAQSNQYAIPNYLTSRQINLHLQIKF